jgi:hypothetical protein
MVKDQANVANYCSLFAVKQEIHSVKLDLWQLFVPQSVLVVVHCSFNTLTNVKVYNWMDSIDNG